MAVAVLGFLLCVLLLVPCVVASGCKHDGREIPEGDVLTTVQPCFTCRCTSGSLQCRLQVCPRLPNPPPPGCELITHTKKCCPQLVCGADKGRKSSSMASSRRSGCQLDGKYYREGTKLPTNAEKLCENCYCIKGQVQCTSITCSAPPHDCKPIIIPGSCCPSRYDCRYIEDPSQSTLFNETRGIKPIYTESSNNLAEETTRNHSKSEQKLSLSGEIPFSSTDSVLLQTLSEGRSNREMSSVIANITEMNMNNQTEETMQSTTVTDTTVSSATEQQYQSSPMSTTTDSSNLTTSDNSIDTTTIGSLVSTMETETLADISYNTTENTSSNNLKTETQTINSNFSATTELTPINSTELSQTHSSVTFSTIDLMRNQTDRPIISKSDNQVKEPLVKEKNKLPFLVNKTAEERIDLALTEEHVLEHNELRIDSTTEIVDDIITMQTESTFMTMMPTTVIMPEEVDTVNITLHSNVNITAYNNKNTLTASNTSVVPVRAIPPEIEAIINNTQKNQDYEEYDYNDPSLPPSLPGVRIIPFVAADAVVEEKPSPTVYPSPEKVRPTDSPVFFDVSHNNMFSPPVETEGGFVPHEPNLDGPFYDSKYNDPYHTTGMSIPSGHLPVDLTTGTIMPPSITILPKDERCLAGGREYHHGAAVPRPGNSCSSCTCYFGEVLCQPLACPPPPPGCHTAKPDPSACCPRLICGDIDTPTVVLEAPQLPAPPQTGVVPPVTVATGVVTPDPFRDVIRTEPAPDLPALMGDIMPYLLERRGSTSPLPSLTTDFTTTGAPIISQSQTTTSSTAHTTKTPLIKSTATTNGNPIAPEEEKEESEFSLDSVLQFLFSGETTAFPATRQTNKTKQVVTTTVGPPTTDRALYELHRNLSNTTAQQNIASTAPPKEGPKTTTQMSTTPATILTTVSQQSGLLSADPGAVSGLLKLAGCNIYGRMYRVGRIISELSGPCLECMCTEVGVQCRALDC